jgi:ribosome-binding protein aMBF1 (putative translation factor)
MTLREARQAQGWSQTRLAAEAGVSVNLLCYSETGRFLLSGKQAGRLATALGIRPDDVDELQIAATPTTRAAAEHGEAAAARM